MNKHDGGPAFPRAASEYTKNGTLPDGNDAIDAQSGMSLRDWFAGMALQGMLARHDSVPYQEVAQWAYSYASAMLEERSKS